MVEGLGFAVCVRGDCDAGVGCGSGNQMTFVYSKFGDVSGEVGIDVWDQGLDGYGGMVVFGWAFVV